MRLLADGSERDGAGDEMLHNVIHRLHLFQRDGMLLEAEEVAQEEGMFLPVGQSRKLLELGIAAQPGSQLESGNGFRSPGMALAVFAIGEQSDVRQQFPFIDIGGKACLVEGRIVPGYLLQADAADGRDRRAKVMLQQLRAHAHGLEYLCPAIGADGADAHLAHHLVQPLAHGLYVVLLGCLIVHLHFAAFHQIIQQGENHVRIDGARAIA